jgi:uncharacterized protein YfaT (DUF1175 family)
MQYSMKPSSAIYFCMARRRSLKGTQNDKLRAMMAERIAQNALKYAPNPTWYIQTIKAILVIGGQQVPRSVVHDFTHFVQQGLLCCASSNTERYGADRH